MTILKTLESLKKHYGTPGETSLIKETNHLTKAYHQVVETASFCALATSGPEGLDCSPRGDAGPVVRIEN